MGDLWAEVGVIASAVLGVCAVLGLAVRYVLMPYLRDQVVKPVQETHRQVTPHDRPLDAEPTIVDRLDDVQTELRELREVGDGLTKKAERNRTLALAAGAAADAANKRLTDHETWAGQEVRHLWAAVSDNRKDTPQ